MANPIQHIEINGESYAILGGTGVSSHEEGYNTEATGNYSHAEGTLTQATATGAHSEGDAIGREAIGTSASTAFGPKAISRGCHAEGTCTIAGDENDVNAGYASHAEGACTIAIGIASHSEGLGTIASGKAQHVQGIYNAPANDNIIHIVGNGTSKTARSNAHTLEKSGDAWFAGNVYTGPLATNGAYNTDKRLVTKQEAWLKSDSIDQEEGYSISTHQLGLKTSVPDVYSSEIILSYEDGEIEFEDGDTAPILSFMGGSGDEPVVLRNIQDGVKDNDAINKKQLDNILKEFQPDNQIGQATEQGGEVFNNYSSNIASGEYSHAEGNLTQASNEAAHAEGFSSKASGQYSHAEGNATSARNTGSHAEGEETVAIGRGAHAEGQRTCAKNSYSHAEGVSSVQAPAGLTLDNIYDKYNNATDQFSVAYGVGSHTEGRNTIAIGNYSHAEGNSTVATTLGQHVEGCYNLIDTDGKYAHILGWGKSKNSRKNIHTIDTSGNGWFAGDVTVGSNNEKLVTESLMQQKIEEAQLSGETKVSSLIVTITDERASHSPIQIYNYIQNGGVAYLFYEGWYYPLTATRDSAWVTFIGDDYVGYTIIISNDGTIYYQDMHFVSSSTLNDFIPSVQISYDAELDVWQFSKTFDELKNLIEQQMQGSCMINVHCVLWEGVTDVIQEAAMIYMHDGPNPSSIYIYLQGCGEFRYGQDNSVTFELERKPIVIDPGNFQNQTIYGGLQLHKGTLALTSYDVLLEQERIEIGQDLYYQDSSENLFAVLKVTDTKRHQSVLLHGIADGIRPEDAVNKRQLDTALGNIELALDSILTIQNNLIGGDQT